MTVAYLPPPYTLPDPVRAYMIGHATMEMSFEAPFVTQQHKNDFQDSMQHWLRYVQVVTQPALVNEQRSSSAALGRLLERTHWSYRDVATVLGVTHTQARRIYHGEQNPRDEVARRIYDLDAVTAALWVPAGRDSSRLRIALRTNPGGGMQSAIEIVHERHDPARAIMHAARILQPSQAGMATIDIGSLHTPNPESGIAADFGD